MSTTSPNPAGDPAHVPGWATVHEDELERPDDPLDETTAPATPGPPSSSPSATSRPEDELEAGAPASSTPGSPLTDDDDRPESGAELSAYLEAELEELGASVLDVAGRALNRLYRRRTQTSSRLWLATQEETEAFGAAAARIAARHLPDELAEDGDPADGLVLGSVALGYVLRNTAGVEAPGPELDEAPAQTGFPSEQPAPPADTSGAAPPPAAADSQPSAVTLPVSTVIGPDL